MTEDTPAVADSVADTPAAIVDTPVSVDWRDSLSQELRDNPSLADVKDLNGLAQRFIDTKQMVGGSLRMPTDDAPAEDIAAFNEKVLGNPTLNLMNRPDIENAESMEAYYNAGGRPEDVSGYVAAEGMDAEVFGQLSVKAHELGLSKAQFEGLAQAQADSAKLSMDNQISDRNAGVDRLRGEWGLAFNDRVERAASTVKALGGHAILEDALASGNVDENTLRFLDTMSVQLGGEGSQIANQINQVNSVTPDELRQRRDETTRKLMGDDLTPKQREELIQKNVHYSELLLATG